MSAVELRELFSRFLQQDGQDIEGANSELSEIISTPAALSPLIELLTDETEPISKLSAILFNQCTEKCSEDLTNEISLPIVEQLFEIIPSLSPNLLQLFSEALETHINVAECHDLVVSFVHNMIESGCIQQIIVLIPVSVFAQLEECFDEFLGVIENSKKDDQDSILDFYGAITSLCIAYKNTPEFGEKIGALIDHYTEVTTLMITDAVKTKNEDNLAAIFKSLIVSESEGVFLFPLDRNYELVKEIITGEFSYYQKYITFNILQIMVENFQQEMEQEFIFELLELKFASSVEIFPNDPQSFDGGSGLYYSLLRKLPVEQSTQYLMQKLQATLESSDVNFVAAFFELLHNMPKLLLPVFSESFECLTQMFTEAFQVDNDEIKEYASNVLLTFIEDRELNYLGSINAKELLDFLMVLFKETEFPDAALVINRIIFSYFETTDEFFEEYLQLIVEIFQQEVSLPTTFTVLPFILAVLMERSQTKKIELFDVIFSLSTELIGSENDSLVYAGLCIIPTLIKANSEQMMPHIETVLEVVQKTIQSDDFGEVSQCFLIIEKLVTKYPSEMEPLYHDFLEAIIGRTNQLCEIDMYTESGSYKINTALNSILSIAKVFREIVHDTDFVSSIYEIIMRCVNSVSCYNCAASFWGSFLSILGREKIFMLQETFNIFQALVSKIESSESIKSFTELTDNLSILCIYLSASLKDEAPISIILSIIEYISVNKNSFAMAEFIESPSELIRQLLVLIKDKEKRAALIAENEGFIMEMFENNEVTASIALAFLYPVITYSVTDELAYHALVIAVSHVSDLPSGFKRNASYFILGFSMRNEIVEEAVELIISLLEKDVYNPYFDNIVAAICILYTKMDCLSLEIIAALLEKLPSRNDITLMKYEVPFYIKVFTGIDDSIVPLFLKSVVAFLSSLKFEDLVEAIGEENILCLIYLVDQIKNSNPSLLEESLPSDDGEKRNFIELYQVISSIQRGNEGEDE